MEEPVYTLQFIKEIIDARKNDVIGLAVSKGDRLTIGKKRSRFVYLFSLLLIMGPIHFFEYSWVTFNFRLKKILASKFSFVKSPCILNYAKGLGIKTFKVKSVNEKKFLVELSRLKPDVIINQAQDILKKDFLAIPTIGVLNRHNALLPKNRGRLAPFWVLYKQEKETGVSIHFVNEGIDNGAIIVQERFDLAKHDNFSTVVKRSYEIAPRVMLKALEVMETPDYDLLKNDDSKATYNKVPSFKDALKFRLSRLGINLYEI